MKELALSIGGKTINTPGGIPTGGESTASSLIRVGVTLFLIFTVILALFYLIQGGIQWITSSGDKQRVEQARQRITYAVVGLIIAILSFFIVSIVYNTFKVQFI